MLHVAPNVCWRRGDGRSVEGRDNLAAQIQSLFAAFPGATLSAANVQAFPPDAVLVEWTLEGVHRGEWWLRHPNPMQPTGRPIHGIGADLLRFNAANEIELDEARVDTAALFLQVAPPATESAAIRDLADRYTAAWNSQIPESVAAFYAPLASLRVNNAEPAIGREAVTAVAASFMTAFPDLQLTCPGIRVHHNRAVYLWDFAGTNTGLGGTGHAVRFSGYEVWRIGADGLIAESKEPRTL